MPDKGDIASTVRGLMAANHGVLPLEPAWVCRDFLPAGHRLGLAKYTVDDTRRGEISERWIASTTKADNAITTPHEGLSYVGGPGQRILLRDIARDAPEELMGEDYAAVHRGMLEEGSLGRLAKIYDFQVRIMFHLHQMQEHAQLVGANSKEEAYYFPPGVDMLNDASTFFGMKHELLRAGADIPKRLLAQYLTEWQEGRIGSYADDWILRYSVEQQLEPEVGYLLPAGCLHGPGSPLTVELQEDSDVFAMAQARLSNNTAVDPSLLWKDVSEERRRLLGVGAVIEQVDWDLSLNPNYTNDYKLVPTLRKGTEGGTREDWIYYGYKHPRFSGTKVTVMPGETFTSQDNGTYAVLVWDGKGTFNEYEIEGTATRVGEHERDEFIVPYETATKKIEIVNTGSDPLMLIKFFGPGINKDVPLVKAYQHRSLH